jgi:hypothetical protein
VRQGGVVLATAGAGRYDAYREPTEAWRDLFGLESRQTAERTTFFRPRQELPFLKPLGRVVHAGWEMPRLGTSERIVPRAEARVLARLRGEDGPALVEHPLGQGRVFYVAALPGVAYFWSALQPPRVPDRGPGTHSVPTNFDPGARALLELVLKAAEVRPTVETKVQAADGRPGGSALVDTRLLRAPGGYVVPLANYHDTVGQAVTLRIRTAEEIVKAVSAWHGELAVKRDGGRTVVTIPKLGYGDVLRLEAAPPGRTPAAE